jgi:hypothetical protein
MEYFTVLGQEIQADLRVRPTLHKFWKYQWNCIFVDIEGVELVGLYIQKQMIFHSLKLSANK